MFSMVEVNFKFDKEKDLYNTWETCNQDNVFGNDFKKNLDKKTLEICRGRTFKECREELSHHKEKIYSSKLIPIFLESVNQAWKEIGSEFFKRLEKVMNKKIYTNKFIAYLTFSGRCPYIIKENAFYFNFFSPLAAVLQTAGHEIIHLQFHNTYWEEIENEIGREKTHSLKEALTVLLNLEFKDLWFVEDKGYEIHRELRNFIANEWKKERDFDVLLRKCIEKIKK